ncbi:translation initiation factor IF-2-like [Mustela erminea]|uniref:translation initiation factor IF-2-like n=1 Tax=Mustela erminea TaxID=36723 RepID=UPI0013868A50|nr:translation initiation factor IF-2-like [Mustela erminea]XP_032217482.1 translation initiation factor IF-2-like [Mustela erminea]
MAVEPGRGLREARPGPRGRRTGPPAERAPSPSGAPRTPHPRRDPGAGSAPAPKPAQAGAAPSAAPGATWPFPSQVPETPAPHPSGASRLRGSRAGAPCPPPRGRVVRAGGGPRSGLCLGLPGLVQSRAASLRDRADPRGFRDFAGAAAEPREEGAGSPRGLSPRPRVSAVQARVAPDIQEKQGCSLPLWGSWFPSTWTDDHF